MTDIIIYTIESTLEHKKGHKKGEEHFKEFFWNFSRFPKRIERGDKVYFATNGLIRGYFIINSINCDVRDDVCQDPMGIPDNSICWSKDSWVNIDLIPTKSFQGFKYADKVEELKNV